MFGAKQLLIFKIEGMHCAHCQATVEKALKAVSGVKSVAVNLQEKTATVTAAAKVTKQALTAAIINAGFEVVE